MSVQSNTVLITGASRGLGANFSKVLAHDGFKIIGVGRNIQNLKSVISSLPNQDLGHSYLELDITDELQVQKMLNDLNIYVDKSAPWELRKTDQVRMKEVLDQISLCILKITQFLAPFIPNGAKKVYSTFGLDESYLSFDKFDEIIEKNSLKISKPEPIFMRIDS